MLKNFRLSVLIAATLLGAIALYGAEKTTAWQGTLVDSNCYLKDNSLIGNDHMGVKGCGTTCLKQGLPAGLLTKAKKYYVLVAPSLALAPYVGEEVRVSGSIHDGVILAAKVEVQKEGKWEEINLKSMM
jgi:hypothetical protein